MLKKIIAEYNKRNKIQDFFIFLIKKTYPKEGFTHVKCKSTLFTIKKNKLETSFMSINSGIDKYSHKRVSCSNQNKGTRRTYNQTNNSAI